MGKGERGKAEKSREEYGKPAYEGSARLAGQSGNLMYGGPSGGYGGDRRTAQPRVSPDGYTQGYQGRRPPGGTARQRQPDVNMQRDTSGAYQQSGSTDYRGTIQNLIGDRPLNTQTMRDLEPQLAQHGMRFEWNADNTRPDIILPNGQQIDFVQNMGGEPGTQRFQWNTVRGGGQPSGQGSGGGISRSQFNEMFPSGSLSSSQLWAKRGELEQMGVEVLTNASGLHHKIRMPNGQVIDVIGGAEKAGREQSGGNRRQWHEARTPGGGYPGGSMSPGGGMTGPGGIAGGTLGDYGNIQNQFQRFADTGGYTPQQIGNIRARSVSPIRSIYSGARRGIDRQRSLQGGYSPNRTAALAKMAREQSYTTADASTNVEAALAQMINQGQRFGMSGMAGMYGATPGLASTFGNQALQGQALQNAMARGMTQDQIAASQLPGAWETTLGRIGQIGGAVMPFVSDRNVKHDIKIAPKILPRLKKLPIHTWKYNDDASTVHMGPMAQDFSKLFGGDNKTIHPVDIAGVALGAIKEIAAGGI